MTLVGERGFDPHAGLPPAPRWRATRVPRKMPRQDPINGRLDADVPHDGARLTALKRRVWKRSPASGFDSRGGH